MTRPYLSPDGRHYWDGQRWQPVPGAATPAGSPPGYSAPQPSYGTQPSYTANPGYAQQGYPAQHGYGAQPGHGSQPGLRAAPGAGPTWGPPAATPPIWARPAGRYGASSGSASSQVQWGLLTPAILPLVLALLPIRGLGLASAVVGLVVFTTRLARPALRRTAVIGIAMCTVAFVIAVAKYSMLTPYH